MKVLSLFSGVGGFDLGLENAGMQTVFQCEWNKHATTVLERHWPDVPRWGDITTLTGRHILDHAPVIDVVAWGSPCQDLSVAGKRAGLSGERSGLFHEGIRIINELRKETNNAYPRISIWENVYGPSTPTKELTSDSSLTKWLRAGRWSSNGESWMRNTSESHNDAAECSSSLSSILQSPNDVPTRYYLSAKACVGILRRAERRGKQLPDRLRKALEAVVTSQTPPQPASAITEPS